MLGVGGGDSMSHTRRVPRRRMHSTEREHLETSKLTNKLADVCVSSDYCWLVCCLSLISSGGLTTIFGEAQFASSHTKRVLLFVLLCE